MVMGFTGTSKGMSEPQRMSVMALLKRLRVTELHHGDCVGADAQAHRLARRLDIPVVLHPPTSSTHRAFARGSAREEPPQPYLTRNHFIVKWSEGLIATPHQQIEILRSGTWATIRYARRLGKPLWIVWPDGTIAYENGARQLSPSVSEKPVA